MQFVRLQKRYPDDGTNDAYEEAALGRPEFVLHGLTYGWDSTRPS